MNRSTKAGMNSRTPKHFTPKGPHIIPVKGMVEFMKRKQVGVYGGSFDPIHFGHLNLAMELLEKHRLDEVWFIPAPLSPHKMDQKPAPFLDRKAMVELAIRDIPQFKMKDLEGHRAPPSYTIDTLKDILTEAKKETDPPQFYLLLGDDGITEFCRWRSPEEIVSLMPLLIGSRTGKGIPDSNNKVPESILSAIQSGMSQTRMLDISSTDIRERLANGFYCGHLIPAPVLDYIESKCLYCKM